MGVHDSNLVVGNNSHTVQWSHSANLTVPSSRKVIANKSIQTKWAASATMASILFGDVNSKNASGGLSAALGFSGSHANTSNVLLLRGAERLRETRAILQKQGEARMRSKRNELNQKGEQVRSGSVALANAISSGKVQKRVVVGVVAAFLLCAALLQILAAARGKLRQAVQVLVTRSLRTAPAPNELLTRPYATWPELTVRVSLDFVNEPANLMLISIGSLQVLATWSKANWWHCKKVNLLVLLLNFAYTLVQEVRAQVLAARHDSAWNLTECTLVSPSGTPEPVLAKDINVGDCIRLQHGDLCPATGELVSTSHTYILFNTLCETGEDCCSILAPGDLVLRGFYLSLEHSEVVICVTETRNGVGNPTDCTGISKPPSDELVPSKSRRMQRFPEHMNRPLAQVNLIALALLFCASALVGALCYLPSGAAALNRSAQPKGAAQQGELSQVERILVTHFFSAAVQLNTVIPSMRWVVLFFLYVFMVEAARPQVRVQNWQALQGLEHRRILYSDKTGTLTEVKMHVARLRVVETSEDLRSPPMLGDLAQNPRNTPHSCCGAHSFAWLTAVLVACNDCQPRPTIGDNTSSSPESTGVAGRRPGTSPEEIAVAEHLQDVLGLVIKTNPLQPGVVPSAGSDSTIAAHAWPLVLCDAATGTEIAHMTVVSRTDFDPAAGCREALVYVEDRPYPNKQRFGCLPPGSWLIRQGGADLMAELAGRSEKEADLAAEDRDRALGWCVAHAADGKRVGAWRYVLRASFANPPRAMSAALVSHCRRAGVSVRMLTGDACVAAVHIAREIGIISDKGKPCCLYIPGETPDAFVARLTACFAAPDASEVSVAIPGSILKQLIVNGNDAWLADERLSAVIYRTRSADKATIVRRTEELGRVRQRAAARNGFRQMQCMGRKFEEEGVCIMMGDAANDAEAISLDAVVGACLRHGATPCKLGADFVIDEPGALLAVRTELRGRALAGAKWLLGDVCLLCGMVSTLTLCGVWVAGFTFLPRGFLYDDPFDARVMTLFSGILYPFSACAAACHVGSQQGWPAGKVTTSSALPSVQALSAAPAAVRRLLLGVALGGLLGLVGPTESPRAFGRWLVTMTSSVCFFRHAAKYVKCTSWRTANHSAYDEAALARLGQPSCAASLLMHIGSRWARAIALMLYVLVAWL